MSADKCPVKVHRDFSSYRCGRPVKRNGMCGIHARAVENKAARDENYRASRDADRARLVAAQNRCDRLATVGVTSNPHYSAIAGKYTGGVILTADEADRLLARMEAGL